MPAIEWLLCWSVAALFLRSGGAYGQEQKEPSPGIRHTLAVSAGMNDFHIKDEYLSPIIFAGRTFASEASFGGESGCHAYAIDVRFGLGSLSSGTQPRDVTQYIGDVSFWMTWKLGAWRAAGSPLEFWLGGGLSSFVMNTDFNTIGQMPADIHYDQSWYWSHALVVHLSSAYRLSERRRLSVEVTVPLYRIVSRPGNGHHFNSRNQEVSQNFLNAALHGKGELLWEDFALQGKAAYVEPLSEQLDLLCTYRFTYASADSPFAMAMYANQFLLGLGWEF